MLDYYFKILSGERKPRFRHSRAWQADLRPEELRAAPPAELWRAHDSALEAMRSRGYSAPITDAGGESGAMVDLLGLKAAIAGSMLSSCCFCERCCGADRAAGELGECGVPVQSRYASDFLHFGEERELVPSQTIFFTGCTFRCVYCQNWDIATRPLSGEVADPGVLARSIDAAHMKGSRNVNFVGGNPDSHLHTCLEIVSRLQTDVPVVWNSNAFASRETMKLLEGVVDIYLSDFRYGNDECAERYSDVSGYWRTVTRNFLAAQSQAEVMLRHLVLPGHLECCTAPVMEWVSEKIPDVYFNLMFQYRPDFHAREYAGLDRVLTAAEERQARELAARYGILPSG